jgi:hypothetical protein
VPAPASAHVVSDPRGALLRVVDHGLLDRLIRGRLWIGLIAFALIGIVAMQLVVLRLNTEIGKGLERKATLQREISGLQVSSSALSAYERVAAEAVRRGMQPAPQGQGGFLAARRSDPRSAAALLSSGSPVGSAGKASASSTAAAGTGESGQASTAAANGGGAASSGGGASGSGATSGGSAAEQAGSGQAGSPQTATSGAGEDPQGSSQSTQSAAGGAAPTAPASQGGGGTAGGQLQAGESAATGQAAGGGTARPEAAEG